VNIPPPSEKQVRLFWTALTGLAIAVIVALVVALVWGLGRVVHVFAPVIWPLAVAGVLACLLDPIVDFLVRKHVPRMRAILVVFVLALVIVVGLFASVVPQLVVEARDLAATSSQFTAELPAKVGQIADHPPKWLPQQVVPLLRTFSENARPFATNAPPPVAIETNAPDALLTLPASPSTTSLRPLADYATRLLPKFGQWLGQALGFAGAMFSVIAGLALVPIYAFYFLLEKHGISQQWRDYLPVQDSKFKDELVFVIKSISEYLVAFFRGQVLVAMCDGVLYTIGFVLIGLPYAMLIGVMATFLTIIPFLGAITTCISALVIALVAFGDWQHPALVLGVFAIVQSLEGLVIQPKIMGERVGLHPVTIIVALMVGTTLLGGILGGILAIPLAAVLRVVLARYVWRKTTNS
jgi:predicted PurR-regulated permease PerM